MHCLREIRLVTKFNKSISVNKFYFQNRNLGGPLDINSFVEMLEK